MISSFIKVDNEISLINQKLDRSRRTNNPKNYYEDGQIVPKEERLPWKNSKTYKRLLRRKRYLSNKLTNQRKNLYEHQVNELLTKGNRFIIEDMNYKALQKRKKETTKDDKGRFIKKSRYGKSLLEHAPSSFINILIRKLGYLGIQIYKVNNQTFKASQYDHTKDEYIKCDLNVRKKNIGNNIVQRDLYSAFLLMNANDDLKTVNKEKCNERFNKFLSLHEIEINRLSKQTNISCIGV